MESFQQELIRLEQAGVLQLDAETQARIKRWLKASISSVPATGAGEEAGIDGRISTGMRLATLFGIGTFAAAWVFFTAQVWASLGISLQLTLIIPPPILLTLGAELIHRRTGDRYLTMILSSLAVLAFGVSLTALAALYNLPSSRNLMLAMAAFALLLAWLHQSEGPLLLAIIAGVGWCWSLVAIPQGLWWSNGFQSLEPLLFLGILTFLLPHVFVRPAHFTRIYRASGAFAICLALMILGESSRSSIWTGDIPGTLPWLEGFYQGIELLILGGLLVLGIKNRWSAVTGISTGFLVLFLLIRYSDWFWDLLPGWIFFLLLGVLSLLVLEILRRLRPLMGSR